MKVQDRWEKTSYALDALNLFGGTRAKKSTNKVMEAYVSAIAFVLCCAFIVEYI